MVELLSPVQDMVSLRAAILSGADAVYFGLKEFSMRAAAKNFYVSELKKVVELCHKNKIKAYLTLNTIIYEKELDKIKKILKKVKAAKVDGIHAWDMSIIKEALKLKIPVHLSTQASVSNSEAVKFYKKMGLKRIILARECSLKQIKDIKKHAKGIEIETFVHGAMCVSISGRCFISQFLFGRSANRGQCIQPCRREYDVKDIEEGHELRLGNKYIMSPKDLCALPFIEEIIETKVDALKIEGRNRSPEYVKTVTTAYRAAIDFYLHNKRKKDFKNKFSALKKQLMEELKKVYNRGFSSGFYLGLPTEKDWTETYGSQATKKKIYVGKIIHFYNKIKVAEIKIESRGLNIGDRVMVQGPFTGVHEQELISMEVNHQDIKHAEKGQLIAARLDKAARKNDKLFVIE